MRANLDSDIVSVIGTDNYTAMAPQTICPDENVKNWNKIVYDSFAPNNSRRLSLIV